MRELTREEKVTIDTYDRHAVAWIDNHQTPGFYDNEIAHFKQLLPTGKVLEIGSGGGRDAKDLIAAGYDYVGTDISVGLLKQARLSNPGTTFQKVSVYDLDFDEPFDGFWCSAVLLHIPRNRIGDALSAIHRNMKPGAIGFITIKEGEGEELEPDNRSGQGSKRYFVYWSDADFTQKLDQNGFEVLERGYRPLSPRSKWLTYFVKIS